MRPGVSAPVHGTIKGTIIKWRERVECVEEVHIVSRFEDETPAFVRKDKALTLLGLPDEALLSSLIAYAVKSAGLEPHPVPETIRLRRRGDLLFVFNYGDAPWSSPAFGQRLLGEGDVKPQDVAVWRV